MLWSLSAGILPVENTEKSGERKRSIDDKALQAAFSGSIDVSTEKSQQKMANEKRKEEIMNKLASDIDSLGRMSWLVR
jgi:hypothetical protein